MWQNYLLQYAVWTEINSIYFISFISGLKHLCWFFFHVFIFNLTESFIDRLSRFKFIIVFIWWYRRNFSEFCFRPISTWQSFLIFWCTVFLGEILIVIFIFIIIVISNYTWHFTLSSFTRIVTYLQTLSWIQSVFRRHYQSPDLIYFLEDTPQITLEMRIRLELFRGHS